MKRILIGLTLFAAACSSGSPTAPTGGAVGQGQSQSAPAAVDPAVGGPAADPVAGAGLADVPQFTLTGPRGPNNCITAGTAPLQWVLNVSDSGPRHLRFVALAHHDEQSGCAATTKNPRARIQLSGTTSYTPHSSGQTVMTFNPAMYNCGRVQVDVSIFDATGTEILIVVLVLDYGSNCAPPPPNSLVCVPPTPPSGPGVPVTFTASGGTGTYSWSAPGGTPASATGTTLTTSYSAAGTYVATVTSGGATATCSVTVPPPITSVVCTPISQTIGVNTQATLFGVGGNGVFAWSAPGASAPSGAGTPFNPTYAAPGTYSVTVASNGATSQPCQVIVVPVPPLVCGPTPQNVGLNALVTVTAGGGTGTYSWSAPGGSTSTGSGGTFNTSYPVAGTNTITVTSGTQTASCTVNVGGPPPPLVCGPTPQNVGLNALVTVTAGGGTGTYSWSAPGGSTSTGSGGTFNTSYPVAGTNTITVTSGTQTALCTVNVGGPPPVLECLPPSQTVPVGQAASVSATGGTGVYVWSAPGGSVTSGTGSSFGTAYALPGTNTITVTSGGATDTCVVIVPPPPPPPPAPICVAAATNPPQPAAGTPLTFNVSNAVAGSPYSWTTAPSGTPATGTGVSFTTSFAAAGTYSITPSTPGQVGAATPCTVTIVPVPPLVCAPPSQIAAIGQPVTVGASGGTGTYSWSAPGGSTATGSGPSFVTSYPSQGTNTITVTSGLQSATCTVSVPPPAVSCAGTTAVFTDTVPPTGGVTVSVPSGQVANINLEIEDRVTQTLLNFPFPNVTGTTPLTFPLTCWGKARVLCVPQTGAPIELASLSIPNVCVP